MFSLMPFNGLHHERWAENPIDISFTDSLLQSEGPFNWQGKVAKIRHGRTNKISTSYRKKAPQTALTTTIMAIKSCSFENKVNTNFKYSCI